MVNEVTEISRHRKGIVWGRVRLISSWGRLVSLTELNLQFYKKETIKDNSDAEKGPVF